MLQTVILHIGYPKTATSSLQWFLHAHRDMLLAQGICYPATGQVADHAHHKLAFALAENEYETCDDAERARLFADLTAELERSQAATVILSSELFLYRLEQIQRSDDFKRLLERRSIRVICFLRRQTTFLESLYRHFIWDAAMRFTEGPDVFLNRYPFAGDYYQTLSAWARFVGAAQIAPLIYEQAVSSDGCIRHFCRAAEIDVEGVPQEDFDVRRNVTVAPNVVTEMMRVANGYRELTREQLIDLAESARVFADRLGALPLPTALFDPELVTRIEAMYLDSNRQLAGEFVRQPLDGPWFREDYRTVAV